MLSFLWSAWKTCECFFFFNLPFPIENYLLKHCFIIISCFELVAMSYEQQSKERKHPTPSSPLAVSVLSTLDSFHHNLSPLPKLFIFFLTTLPISPHTNRPWMSVSRPFLMCFPSPFLQQSGGQPLPRAPAPWPRGRVVDQGPQQPPSSSVSRTWELPERADPRAVLCLPLLPVPQVSFLYP